MTLGPLTLYLVSCISFQILFFVNTPACPTLYPETSFFLWFFTLLLKGWRFAGFPRFSLPWRTHPFSLSTDLWGCQAGKLGRPLTGWDSNCPPKLYLNAASGYPSASRFPFLPPLSLFYSAHSSISRTAVSCCIGPIWPIPFLSQRHCGCQIMESMTVPMLWWMGWEPNCRPQFLPVPSTLSYLLVHICRVEQSLGLIWDDKV